ncbi:hypothetical protein FNV43_RR22691 [Rhamnella rubrinervis]|uniref:Uncharacterized protein n=1 Tax=Rhamnella rubrinervis TaxID=2594499 RepID=A0A8K0DXK2_9ROSA|nr:hypothetical protein FNV43_RR22691 [Rhamnella rubrinervis]
MSHIANMIKKDASDCFGHGLVFHDVLSNLSDVFDTLCLYGSLSAQGYSELLMDQIFIGSKIYLDCLVVCSQPTKQGGLAFTISRETIWIIGVHFRVRLWVDNWLGIPIIELLHNSGDLCDPGILVDDLVDSDGVWNLPTSFREAFSQLTTCIEDVEIAMDRPDERVWAY